MPLTALAQNMVLDALMRGQPILAPSIYYVALVTTEGPTNSLAGQEVLGGAYARVPIPATLSGFSGTQGEGTTGISVGGTGLSSNNIVISFPQPTDNWGSIVGYEFWDAATFGARWFYDVLKVPKTVSAGDPVVTFPIGELEIVFS